MRHWAVENISAMAVSTYLSNNCKSFCFLIIFLMSFVHSEDYLPLYQPELENVRIDTYINNPRLINLEIQCLLYDGPCDIVGRFIKPRIAKGLLGECVLCTPKQEKTLAKLLDWVQTNRPELYKLAIAKYLEKSGIVLPPTELAKLEELEKKEGIAAIPGTSPSLTA